LALSNKNNDKNPGEDGSADEHGNQEGKGDLFKSQKSDGHKDEHEDDAIMK